MLSKKIIFHHITSFLYALAKQKKIIVFDAPMPFHLVHFTPVINELSKSKDVLIVVICPQEISSAIFTSTDIKIYKDLPLYIHPRLFISTDFVRLPWWLNCPSAFFGHGIGPKLNYVFNEGIHEYDFIYSPCRPVYDIQLKQVSEDKLIPIGLPIIESSNDKSLEIAKHFELDKEMITVLYAPSWCNNSDMISPIDEIIEFLAKQKNINLIVSPHPLLLNKDRCDSKVFFQNITTLNNVNFNTKYQTFDLLTVCDAVVGDISSIMFEAMALNKVIILDGNHQLYHYCQASTIYEALTKICPTITLSEHDEDYLHHTISNDEHQVQRLAFIDHYLFNKNNATNIMSKHILSII